MMSAPTLKCPCCNCVHNFKSHVFLQVNTAREIFGVTAECPVCLNECSSLMALPCGHVLCKDDYQRMDGLMPSLFDSPNQVKVAFDVLLPRLGESLNVNIASVEVAPPILVPRIPSSSTPSSTLAGVFMSWDNNMSTHGTISVVPFQSSDMKCPCCNCVHRFGLAVSDTHCFQISTAREIFGVTAECPVCLNECSSLMALPCGHVLCKDDYQRMGGLMPSSFTSPTQVKVACELLLLQVSRFSVNFAAVEIVPPTLVPSIPSSSAPSSTKAGFLMSYMSTFAQPFTLQPTLPSSASAVDDAHGAAPHAESTGGPTSAIFITN